MANLKCVGLEYKEYTSKKTGRLVKGFNAHFTQPFPADSKAEGVSVFAEWISPEIINECDLHVGDECNLSYNRYGRIENIYVAG